MNYHIIIYDKILMLMPDEYIDDNVRQELFCQKINGDTVQFEGMDWYALKGGIEL